MTPAQLGLLHALYLNPEHSSRLEHGAFRELILLVSNLKSICGAMRAELAFQKKGYLDMCPVVLVAILHEHEDALQQVVGQVAPLRVQVQPLQSLHQANLIADDGGDYRRDLQLLPAEDGSQGKAPLLCSRGVLAAVCQPLFAGQGRRRCLGTASGTNKLEKALACSSQQGGPRRA